MTPEKKHEMLRRGATIRALHEAHGVSPQQLANKVGIARPTLTNIELGHRDIRPELLPKFAAALEVPPIAIMWSDYMEAEKGKTAA